MSRGGYCSVEVMSDNIQVMEGRGGGEGASKISEGGGVRGAEGVYKVSSVGGSSSEGGEVGSDGSGPVWAGGFWVKDGG